MVYVLQMCKHSSTHVHEDVQQAAVQQHRRQQQPPDLALLDERQMLRSEQYERLQGGSSSSSSSNSNSNNSVIKENIGSSTGIYICGLPWWFTHVTSKTTDAAAPGPDQPAGHASRSIAPVGMCPKESHLISAHPIPSHPIPSHPTFMHRTRFADDMVHGDGMNKNLSNKMFWIVLAISPSNRSPIGARCRLPGTSLLCAGHQSAHRTTSATRAGLTPNVVQPCRACLPPGRVPAGGSSLSFPISTRVMFVVGDPQRGRHRVELRTSRAVRSQRSNSRTRQNPRGPSAWPRKGSRHMRMRTKDRDERSEDTIARRTRDRA